MCLVTCKHTWIPFFRHLAPQRPWSTSASLFRKADLSSVLSHFLLILIRFGEWAEKEGKRVRFTLFTKEGTFDLKMKQKLAMPL